MITTGIITDINYDKVTKNTSYSVDIAIFKNAGISNEINSSIFDCPCSVNPGTYVPYNIGDKVYIGFVNNKWNLPIILGKIYESLPDESINEGTTYQYISSLKVTGNTTLSENTVIGNTTWKEIQDNFIKLNEFQENFESNITIEDLKTLKEIISWWEETHSEGE